MADGCANTIEPLTAADSEGAREVIESIAGAGHHYHLAVNLPNRGQPIAGRRHSRDAGDQQRRRRASTECWVTAHSHC